MTTGQIRQELADTLIGSPRRPFDTSLRCVNAQSLPAINEATILLRTTKPSDDASNTSGALLCFPLEPGLQARLSVDVDAADPASKAGTFRLWLARERRLIGNEGAEKFEYLAEHAFDIAVATTASPPQYAADSLLRVTGNLTAIADALSITNNHQPTPYAQVHDDGRAITMQTWGARYLFVAGNIGTFSGMRLSVASI